MNRFALFTLLAALAPSLAACGAEHANGAEVAARLDGPAAVARVALLDGYLEVSGRTEPIESATLSTRLMGQVLEVAVREGDRVAAGALLVRLDARDLDARRRQVEAQLAQAEAARHEAGLAAGRIRALFADSAAPRAHLDAAEAGLARAEAAVAQAQAAGAEVEAMAAYAEVRAPFAGTVTQRFVDPGAFAAPGMPLVTVQNTSRLRLTATAGPEAVRGLERGRTLDAAIEGSPARGTVEGVVPSADGRTWTVNVVVDNAAGAYLPQSAATLHLPTGRDSSLVVPAAAVRMEGDLASVRIVKAGVAELRWVRLGRRAGDNVIIEAGLVAGDSVLLAGAR